MCASKMGGVVHQCRWRWGPAHATHWKAHSVYFVCVCIYTCIHTHTYTHTHTHTYNVCVYTCARAHTHKHTHTEFQNARQRFVLHRPAWFCIRFCILLYTWCVYMCVICICVYMHTYIHCSRIWFFSSSTHATNLSPETSEILKNVHKHTEASTHLFGALA